MKCSMVSKISLKNLKGFQWHFMQKQVWKRCPLLQNSIFPRTSVALKTRSVQKQNSIVESAPYKQIAGGDPDINYGAFFYKHSKLWCSVDGFYRGSQRIFLQKEVLAISEEWHWYSQNWNNANNKLDRNNNNISEHIYNTLSSIISIFWWL